MESTGEKRPLYDGESQGLLPYFHEDSIQMFLNFSKISLESLGQLLFLFFWGGAKLVKIDENRHVARLRLGARHRWQRGAPGCGAGPGGGFRLRSHGCGDASAKHFLQAHGWIITGIYGNIYGYVGYNGDIIGYIYIYLLAFITPD